MGVPGEPIRLGPGPEFDLIRRILAAPGPAGAPAALRYVRVGPGDDCAVVAPENGLAVSADLSVEGTHFRRAWLAPQEIGYRAAAASLSDLAAVAAEPIGVLASLALPEADVPEAALELMAGVRAAAAAAGALLLGGDVARTDGPLAVDVVALGRALAPVLRRGAQPGDEVWVTGRLGAAAAAVHCWLAGRTPPAAARAAFARPRPRLAEARWLAERGVLHAMIDLSDGLAGDLRHLAAASGVRIVLEPDAVPVHPAALEAAGPEAASRLALAGGEDYELCFAAPPGAVTAIGSAFREAFGLELTRVGAAAEGEGVWIRGAGGALEPLRLAGYQHFGGATT